MSGYKNMEFRKYGIPFGLQVILSFLAKLSPYVGPRV